MLDHLGRAEHLANAKRISKTQEPSTAPGLPDPGPLPSTSAGANNFEVPAGDDQEPFPDDSQQETLSVEIEEAIQRIACVLAGLDEEDYLDFGDGEERGLEEIDEVFPEQWYDAEGRYVIYFNNQSAQSLY